MMSFLNQRADVLQPSATLAVAAKASELKAAGKNVISLSVGQPDFPTPAHACEAAKDAIDAGFTGYTAAGGIPELKQAIQDKLQRDQDVNYELNQITCSNGGKAILFNLFQVILNPGDEVILSNPAWLSYATQIRWAGGVPVFVETKAEDGFCMKPEVVEQAITEKTRAIVVNSPANPTGGVMPAEDVRGIAELALEHDFLFISDDVYEHFYYGQEAPAHVLKLMPEMRDRTVLVNAVSKTYSMTGWRVGYAAGPADIIGKMQALQSQEASNPCSIAQKAAIAALNGPQDSVEEMRLAFARRRQLVAEALDGKLPYVMPEGAFYFMLDIRPLMAEGESDVACCTRLLEERLVALVPGGVFGSVTEGWARMSFAVSDEDLLEAMRRLTEGL